ncbi:MAG: TraB/GumN family protein, partial [Bacteroidetes bacterium]|nr:TraB/GumN family protein [Bacteroidota bacterium]
MKCSKRSISGILAHAVLLFMSYEAFGQKNEEPQAWNTDTAAAAPAFETNPIGPAKPKKYPSLLWEISGNGAKKKSYLYGTMHVSRKLAFRLSDTFFMGLKGADVVALESDPGTWINRLAEDQSGVYPWTDWWTDLDRKNYNEAFSMSHLQNRMLARIISREENLANSMLYRKDDRSGDFSEDTYLDLFIYQAGKKLGKTVTGLEDFRESRKMVNRSEKEDKDADNEDRPRINRWEMNFGEEIENAYRQGDLDLLDSLDRMLNPGKNYRKWMLYERNKVMARGIDAYIRSGKSIFSGVGASHLPGDTGVIELLRRMGYTVRPVSPKSSGKARKEKDRIDALEYNINPIAYKSVNSDFEALMPGVPISAFSEGNYRYFHPDAANGSYISIAKLPYYGKFTGQTPAHMLLRVDSLLFEYVRGRIISKNNTIRNGFAAMDIRNRTAQGNGQRLMVIATPTYLWFVKMSGQKDYVFGKNGESFFNSFRITENAGQNWSNYSPECGGYSIRWPENLSFKRGLGDTNTYLQGHRDLEASDKNGDYYFLKRLINTDVDYVEEDSFELYWLAQGLAESLKSKVSSPRYLSIQGHPALEARMKPKTNGSNATVRFLIQGQMIYTWGTTAADNRDFLESFRIEKFKYAGPFTLQHDSMHWFSAQTLPIPNFNRLRESMGYMEDEPDSM